MPGPANDAQAMKRLVDGEPVQEPILRLTDDPDPAIQEEISAALVRYNEAQVGPYERRRLIVTLRDARTNEIIGGLAGRTALGMFFIDLLVVPRDLQGRGCRTAVLNSANFQSPEFYARYGYQAFGEIEGDPGVTRTFLSKTLIQPSSAGR